MKRSGIVLPLLLMFTIACGGGGSGEDSGGSQGTPIPTPTPDPSVPTPPITVGNALFVRDLIGSDDNDGRSPATAFSTIQRALEALPGLTGGRRIIVGPGTYNGQINAIPDGSAEQPVVLFADPTGILTQDRAGIVTLTSTGTGSTILLTDRQFVTIDGFLVRGASGGNNAGIDVRNSSQIIVRNCDVTGTADQADGIAILASDDVAIINNLVHNNARRGIRVAGGGSGSRGVFLINNTVARNGGQGVVVGTAEVGSQAILLFNIIQDNVGPGIFVTEPSLGLFEADSNLVFPPRYDPPDLPREFSIEEDALFVDAASGNFLLSDVGAGQSVTSPAIDSGFEEIFPEALLEDLDALKQRTTSTTGDPDTGELDLGFHAPTLASGPGPGEQTYYVRVNGDDSRTSGRSPVDAFRTLHRALGVARAGDTIIVGPGEYGSRIPITVEATAAEPLTVRADPSGTLTEDAPGAVIIAAGGTGLGFRLTGAAHVSIDGFTIHAAGNAAFEIRGGSDHITVRNCVIDAFGNFVDTSGDGIRVDDSSNVSLINNVVSFNDAIGILVRRSTDTRIINNTVVENGVRGIRIGSGSGAAPNTLLQNNIVNFSGESAIEFNTPSATTAMLSHNLVFPADYLPRATSLLPRPTDIDADPRFVGFANYRLANDSPARDAADPNTDPGIRADLANRTTSENDAPDTGVLDIGYHFPILPTGSSGE